MLGAQFFYCDPFAILLGLPGATIYEFDDGPLHETIYEETESYQITEMFINNREGVLRHMLAE